MTERDLDAGLDKLLNMNLASCHANLFEYTKEMENVLDKFATMGFDVPIALREAHFRHGLSESLRIEATILQAAEGYPTKSKYIVATSDFLHPLGATHAMSLFQDPLMGTPALEPLVWTDTTEHRIFEEY